SLVFTKSIADPISDLIKSMQMLGKGLFKPRVKEARIKEIRDLDRSFNRMTAQIADLIETNKEEEAKLHTAERKALEAQINPHFLYNTLNTIKSLARINGQDEIYTIAVRLGKLLRANIDNDKALTSLGESFALVESYLIIQKIRFSSKLEYTIELEDSIAQIQTPKLILQPFVENAIGHGLEPKVGSWMLAVKGWKDGPRIHLSVEDNGVGFEDSLLKDLESLKDSGHVGVYNTYRRLRLHYGQSAYVSFSHRDEGGTRVDISFPIQEEKEMEKWPTQ
ncbi:MAG: sensor histidine kinase, partial [Sphaerochaetaceae bacterium]